MCSVCKPPTPSGRKFQASLGCKVVCSFWLQAQSHSVLDGKSGGNFKDPPRSKDMKCLLGKALSPTIYFLLAILQILQYCCNAEAGNINIAPMTQHANLSQSDYATFYCRATGSNTLWNINEDTFESRNHTMNGYIFSEVIVGVQADLLVHDMFLEVPTTPEYNITMIKCVVFVDRPEFSDPVQLIVQGGPGAPVPVLTMINTSLMVLEWEAPFTWPHTSIHHYTISANTSQVDWNRIDYVGNSLQIKASETLAECTVYAFTVIANNELADGVPGTVTGGFPVAPRMPQDPITEAVTFTSNQQPIIQLILKLPVVCGYQRVRYQLTVSGPDAEVLYHDGPHSQLYGNGKTVTYVFENLSNINFIYATARYELDEVAESDISNMVITAYRNFSVGLTSGDEGSGLDAEQVVLIAAVGGALILIAVVFIVVLATVCAYRKRGRFRAGSRKSSPMVTNPIYEGNSVYETIDPHFRPISFTSSHSLPPPTPTSSRPLIESPYAHSQVDPSYASPQLPSMEEEYTVMSSAAGGFTKVSSLSEDSNLESNLDRRSSDMARYVPEPSMLASEC